MNEERLHIQPLRNKTILNSKEAAISMLQNLCEYENAPKDGEIVNVRYFEIDEAGHSKIKTIIGVYNLTSNTDPKLEVTIMNNENPEDYATYWDALD